jgi:predicted anti-sigma-YlaC factor YlaD
MNFLNISCKQATYLVSKKEENKLTWLEKIKLRGHMSICSICRYFEEQTAFIGRMTKHTHTEAHLPENRKEQIRQSLKD